jgi:hypothetical protein
MILFGRSLTADKPEVPMVKLASTGDAVLHRENRGDAPMRHAPSTAKRSTCLPASCHFLMRPQLLTRI